MMLPSNAYLCRRELARACAVLLGLAAALALCAPAQAPTTTTVTGTVYLANGQPGSGTLVVSWPSFTTAGGQLIAADSTTVTIPSNGFVSVNLAPNQGATPAGEYYTAVFYMSDGSTSTQYWVVPAASSATLAAVQAQVMPAAQAVQTVSKAYVDEAIAELTEGEITALGGTLTGPLYLSGDPTQPLQAADKHYVDTEVAADLPLTGGTLSGPITATKIGAAYQVDQFAGADFGAKLAACLSTLSATYGGACDARNFTGSQAMASNLTISTSNATILLPCATIATANQFIVSAGTRNVALRGCALRGGSAASGSQGGTVFAYTGAGPAIQVGDPTYATDTPGFHLDNAVINLTGSTSATAKGFVAYRTQELDVESTYLLGNSNQTGMTLDGTGNYTGGTFLDDQFGGFATAVNAIGHQAANPATTDWVNASTFVRLHIDCPTSGGSPIGGTYGINLQQGDGDTFTGGDVENCSTALHLGANAQNNTIVGLRNENSTNQVVADAGSSYNSWIAAGTLFTGQINDNGTHNSFWDSFHRGFNGVNGDLYRSQIDSTLTNHAYFGIGLGHVRGLVDEYITDVPGSPGNYQSAWQWGPGDGASGQQVWSLLDMLNNVQRFGVQQNTTAGGSPQSYLNAAGSGNVCFQCSANAGTGGAAFGSGGSSPATVATIDSSGDFSLYGYARFFAAAAEQWRLNCASSTACNIDDFNSGSGVHRIRLFTGAGTDIDAEGTSAVTVGNTNGSGTGGFRVYLGGSNYNTLGFYVGNSSGSAIYQFPGVAASSGTNCLQVDASGYLSNTGSGCGSGGGGTVSSGSTSQIAYYNASGTTVAGNAATVSGTGLGTFAGVSDSTRPTIDTPTIASGYNPASPTTGASGGGGTDECARLMQLSYNADQGGFTNSIFRSNTGAAASTIACSVAGFWDPALLTPSPTLLPETQGSTVLLSPGSTWKMAGELDVPTMSTLDGQAAYGYLATPNVGTFLEPNPSSYPVGAGAFGTVGVNLDCPAGSTVACYGLASVAKNFSYNCNSLPGMTGFLNASGQQFSRFERTTANNCNTGFAFENLPGGGGSQNMGLNVETMAYGTENVSTPAMTGYVLTAGGSGYASAPTVSVTGCATSPSITATVGSGAVTALAFGPPNYYGTNCGSSAAISFSGGGGSGAAATAVTQNFARSVGYRVNYAGNGAGWGMWLKPEVVAGANAIGSPEGYELNEGGIYLHAYSEGTNNAFKIADKHTDNLPLLIFGAENNPADNNPGQAVVEINNFAQYNGLLGMGLIGIGQTYQVLDDDGNPCTIPQTAENYQEGVLLLAEEYWGPRISTDPNCVTQLPIGNALTEAALNYQFVPVKNVSGKVEPMTVGDSSEPVGVAINGDIAGYTGATLNKMSYATHGLSVPCLFAATETPTPGDWIVPQLTGTAPVSSAAGCHDAGSTRPTSGYILGQLAFDGIYGSDSIPSTPSAPSLTRSSIGSIQYCYEIVQATLLDASQSVPTSATCDSTGPGYLSNGGYEKLTGLSATATAPVKIWRTTLGSTLPSGCTLNWSSGAGVTGGLSCTGYGAGLNPFFPPSLSIGCTGTAPTVNEVIVSAGAVVGVNFKSLGSCTASPTVSWSHNAKETGFIGISIGSTFTDGGLSGDGTTPNASGQLAPRVALHMEQAIGASAGVSGLSANGGAAQTGNLNLVGSAVSQSGANFTIGSNAGFGFGLVEQVMPQGATPYLVGMGDSYTLGTSSTGVSQPATSTTPLLAQSTSGGAGSEAAGWYSNANSAAVFWPQRSPVLQFLFRLPNSADYGSTGSLRLWMGLASSGCNGTSGSWSTLIGTDSPTSCNLAAIRYSNNAGDAEFQLVTCNTSACSVTPFSTSAVPSTSLSQVSITVNSGANVVATIGALGGTQYQATSTTDLPAAVAMAPVFANADNGSNTTHLQMGSIYGYDPASSY
jgi:hypothetical protein